MRIRTVLNHCYRFKSFVYQTERWNERDGKSCLVVDYARFTHRFCGRPYFCKNINQHKATSVPKRYAQAIATIEMRDRV